jgi:sec-independent protein translocase protein TatA
VHLNPPAELFGEQGIIVLIVVALVLFGSTQIPKLARSLGSAQKEFKKGLDDGATEADMAVPPTVHVTVPPSVGATAGTSGPVAITTTEVRHSGPS